MTGTEPAIAKYLDGRRPVLRQLDFVTNSLESASLSRRVASIRASTSQSYAPERVSVMRAK